MTSESSRTLRDFVSLQRGTTYKGALVGISGPVLLGLASIEPNGGFRYRGFKTYGGECPEKISLKPGDIYVSLKDVTQSADLLGAVARVPIDIPSGRLTQDTVKLVFNSESISKDYVYWLLRTPSYRSYCRERATGTTTLGLSRDDFLDFPVPSLTTAGTLLVELLDGIEKRVALLRETNATLEAIAQALFESWLINFDPVIAKVEGVDPGGIDSATASLFPDSFELSELGLVPKGWQILALADAYEINPSRKLKKGEVAPYLDMANVGTRGHVVSNVAQREMGSGTKFINGDTLLARITPCLENGKCAFVDFLSGDQVGWGSTEFVVLRPKAPLPAYHGYLLARHSAFREHAMQSMSGTSGRQRVQNDVLGRYPVVVPSEEVAEVFEYITDSIQQKIAVNQEQSKSLIQLRDTLLPRLFLGEMRLPAMDSSIENISSETV
jgi:type I restriction enzyme S subunit